MARFLQFAGLRGIVMTLTLLAIVGVSLARALNEPGPGPVARTDAKPPVNPAVLLPSLAHPPVPTPIPTPVRTSAGPKASASASQGAAAGTSAPSSPSSSGRAGAPTSSRPASASPSAPFTPSAALLTAALLTVSQLPGSGFTEDPASSASAVGNLTECPVLLNMQESASAVESVSFSAAGGPFLTEILVQYSVAGAEATMAQFAQVPQVCPAFTTTLSGYTLRITLSNQSFPAYGDQTAALGVQVAFVGTPYSVYSQLVAVRHGGTVIAVTNIGIPLDTALTQEVVAIAYGNVISRW